MEIGRQQNDHGIERVHLEKQRPQQTCGKNSSHRPYPAAQQPKLGARYENQFENTGPLRSERHSNCHFMSSHRGRKRDHAVDSQNRQEHRRAGEAGNEHRIETA